MTLQKYTSLNNLQFTFFTIKYNISEKLTGNQRTEIKMDNIEIKEEILPSSIVEVTFTVRDTSTVEVTCTVPRTFINIINTMNNYIGFN